MNPAPGWGQRIDQRLDSLRDSGRWRAHRPFDAWGPRGTLDNHPVVSFASNDYLGLTTHPNVIAAAHAALDRWGSGSGAAHLVTGTRPVHVELEEALAEWKQAERVVLFPTGFAANLGVLSTLGTAGVQIISDELNHASIIDGARLAKAEVAIWRHGDLDDLEGLVADAPGPVLVAADTVFSMDGDALDVTAVLEICRRHDALLVLDEAHAVFGPHLGPDDLAGVEVVRVGTLSKTLGSIGGFVACSNRVADLLVNTARPAIFTTATTPGDTAAALAAVRVLLGHDGEQRIATLRRHIDRVTPGHPSPIVPIVIGGETAAVEASATLLEAGLLVPAIRPPTVPAGTSRLRVTLNADHTDDEVARLVHALEPFR